MEVTTTWENSTPALNFENGIEDLSRETRAILCLLLLLATGVSLLGNTVTCLIVYRKKTMRSAINLLLSNIAGADLVMTSTVAPFLLYNLLHTTPPAFAACVSVSVLKDTSLSVGAYTLLVISVDRYLIIVHRRDRLCPKFVKVLIGVIWIGSVIISCPQFLSLVSDRLVTSDKLFCQGHEPGLNNYKLAYTLILMSVIFYAPDIVMFYTYAAILRTVRLSSIRIHNHSGSAVSISVTQYSSKLGMPIVAVPCRFTGDFNAKRKAFGTILLLFITLLLCWIPYTASRLLTVSARGDVLTETVFMIVGCLKNALYPIIFCARNKKFRNTCLRFFPTSLRMPKTCFERKQRRVNPKTLYQCSEVETRV